MENVPIYVKVDKYKELVEVLKSITTKLQAIDKTLERVRTTRANRLGIFGIARWSTDLPAIVEPSAWMLMASLPQRVVAKRGRFSRAKQVLGVDPETLEQDPDVPALFIDSSAARFSRTG